MKRLIILSLLFHALTVFADEIEMVPLVIPTARNNGMGGDHAAYTDNVYALLVNPAAILRVQESASGAFSVAITNPKQTFDMFRSVGNIAWDALTEDISALARILEIYKGDSPTGFDLREFPLSYAWVSNGLGIGIWNRIFIDQDSFGGLTQNNLYCDVILPISAAFPIVGIGSHSLDIGVTLKPFARIMVQELKTDSIPLIAGTGINAGILYRWDKGFSLGFTVNDIFTFGKTITNLPPGGDTTPTYYVPTTMNLGLAYELKIGNFAPDAPAFLANTGIAVAVDWRDIRSVFWQNVNYEDIWLEANAGLQVTLFDIFMLRGGMSKMQPVAGIGVNLASFQIDAAYSTKENVLELTFAVRPRAKESHWFWAQNPLFGSSAGSKTVNNDTASDD